MVNKIKRLIFFFPLFFIVLEWHLLDKVYNGSAHRIVFSWLCPSQLSLLWVLSLQIAKVEKLKPLEVELRRLEDLSESIVNDFAYMKRREEEMRDTNGKQANAISHWLK